MSLVFLSFVTGGKCNGEKIMMTSGTCNENMKLCGKRKRENSNINAVDI